MNLKCLKLTLNTLLWPSYDYEMTMILPGLCIVRIYRIKCILSSQGTYALYICLRKSKSYIEVDRNKKLEKARDAVNR